MKSRYPLSPAPQTPTPATTARDADEPCRVLVALQDIGGSNALVPVIRELRRRPKVALRLVAAGKAQEILRAARISFEPMARPSELDAAYQAQMADVLAQERVDVLLVGTSFGPSIEKALAGAATSLGVPSLAVIDTWSNYRSRFSRPSEGDLAFLTTTVAVPDDVARREAIAEGLPAAVLVVTGQPHLESIRVRVHSASNERAARSLRAKWSSTLPISDPLFALFASEVVEPSDGSDPHFSERDALDRLMDAVDELPQSLRSRTRIVAKLHPEESVASNRLSDRLQRVHAVLEGIAPWPCLLASDCIVGIGSTILLEAGLAGIPAIACQPGGKAEAFSGVRLGLVAPASSSDELAVVLADALRRSQAGAAPPSYPQPTGQPPAGSAQRIADEVLDLARARARTQ